MYIIFNDTNKSELGDNLVEILNGKYATYSIPNIMYCVKRSGYYITPMKEGLTKLIIIDLNNSKKFYEMYSNLRNIYTLYEEYNSALEYIDYYNRKLKLTQILHV